MIQTLRFTVPDDGDKFFYSGMPVRQTPRASAWLHPQRDGIGLDLPREEPPLFPGATPHALKVGNVFLCLYNPVAGELQMRIFTGWVQVERTQESHGKCFGPVRDPCR